MRTGEIHAVLVRHQLLPYGVTGAGTQVLGLTDTAEVARALLALEARLREVERERDALARLASIEKAAGDALQRLESWDCSSVWEENDEDCIANRADDPCCRCEVLATLRAAMEGKSDA